MMDRETVRNM